MALLLEIDHLRKAYPGFLLKDLTFAIQEGTIMGFIGRNGAGKTTTLKCLLNLIHPDAGSIRFFGMDLAENEYEIKQRIGFAGGAVDYYRKKRIADIVAVTKQFYDNWDNSVYRRYLQIFNIDEQKTPEQLSEGAQVKLSLALAMSHHAELLILDEPTSGLDPVSRAELTDTFKYLKKQGVAILFSTHITSDLENCADVLTYIRNGELIASEPLLDFVTFHRVHGYGATLEKIMLKYERGTWVETLAD